MPRSSSAEGVRRYTAKRQEYLNGIKGLRGCYDCGIWLPPEILEFDHVPERGAKSFSLGACAKPWDRLTAEVAKCDVVCPTCHRARTHGRGPYR